MRGFPAVAFIAALALAGCVHGAGNPMPGVWVGVGGYNGAAGGTGAQGVIVITYTPLAGSACGALATLGAGHC